MEQANTTAAGWYRDPANSAKERYWDGQTWTPDTRDTPPAPPAAEKKKGGGSLIVKIALGVILAVIVLMGGCVALIGMAANEGAEEIDRQQAEALEEVTLESCEAAEFTGADAAGVARNGSSERSDYWIEVTFLAADGTVLDTGYGDAQNVEPGGVAQWKASAFAPGVENVDRCEVVSVNRTASM